MRAATAGAVACLLAGALVVIAPTLASATAPPILTLSPTSGPIGTVVTVTFGPGGNGCGLVGFGSDVNNGPDIHLPFVGDHGTQRFVIPRAMRNAGKDRKTPLLVGRPYFFSLTCDTTNNPATAYTDYEWFTVTATPPASFSGMATTPSGNGYWLAESTGGVRNYGDAHYSGGLPNAQTTPTAPIVGIAATPTAKGYWTVGADGSVYPFGDAGFYGSTGGRALNAPIVGIAVTRSGKGYWEVASDGGIFTFGDARFHGSMGGTHLNQPVVAMSADPVTGGYREVASDGGVFTFAARYFGSTGDMRLNQPIVGMGATPSGRGYRLVAVDGGIFDFGDAKFFGSGASRGLPTNATFVGLDRDTGVVNALDTNGTALETLFSVPVEEPHHWPTATQFQLTPDHNTLWYSLSTNGAAQCASIVERNLATGEVHTRFKGTWISLSPDGTQLAYTDCVFETPIVHVVRLDTGEEWTARAPSTPGRTTPLGFVTWTPDSRQVLAEYLTPSLRWKLSALTPGYSQHHMPWGPTVLEFRNEARLGTTDAWLYTANAIRNTYSIDTYMWDYHRIAHTPLTLEPIEVVAHSFRTYFVGGQPTGGSSLDLGLYRVEADGSAELLRPGIGEVVAVGP